MKLIKGKKYCYWNRRSDDIKPTRKVCRLISISNDGKYVTVERADLTVNKIQKIEAKRLLEISPISVSVTEKERKLF